MEPYELPKAKRTAIYRTFYRPCDECGKFAKTSPYLCRNCTRNLDRKAKRYRANKLKTKTDTLAIKYMAEIERKITENPNYLQSICGQRRSGLVTVARRVGEIMNDPKYVEQFQERLVEGNNG